MRSLGRDLARAVCFVGSKLKPFACCISSKGLSGLSPLDRELPEALRRRAELLLFVLTAGNSWEGLTKSHV